MPLSWNEIKARAIATQQNIIKTAIAYLQASEFIILQYELATA
jgi:hypothetical protein